MFSYFPGNYVWNLSVMIALQSGGEIGEIDEMCSPLREAASQGDDPGTGAFLHAWVTMADKLAGLANEDLSLGREFSAAEKLHRSALYYQMAERMQPTRSAEREAVFAKSISAFTQAASFGSSPLERVEIPYLDGIIPGWLRKVEGGKEPRPTLVFLNGLDSTKEMLVWTRLADELARRGVATLHLDQPGTGEALRNDNLTATPECEWASTVFDAVASRNDVDAERIGIMGLSLGGYYAPRVLANESRFALGAVWGANHNWGEIQQRRLQNEGERPVPHYWEHVRWVWGAKDMEEFLALCPRINLDGHLEGITAPFLVTHGENDRQIPPEYAHRTYEQLTNSSRRELKVFDEHTGGIEHVSVDNMSYGRSFIADWVAESFGQPNSNGDGKASRP